MLRGRLMTDTTVAVQALLVNLRNGDEAGEIC